MGFKRLRGAAWVLGSLALLALCSLGLLAMTEPAIAALGCPGCFGFEHLSARIYVDPPMPNATRAMLLQADADAASRLIDVFGVISTDPVILACSDEDCQRRIDGGGARGMSYASFGLRLSPRGLNPTTVLHERTLIELQHRLGLMGFIRGDIPEWFLEGTAVVVSGNPRDLFPEDVAGSRCRIEPGDALPATSAEFRHTGAMDSRIYARAACRVLRWMDANGGGPAVSRLIAAVAGGGRFTSFIASRRTLKPPAGLTRPPAPGP